MKKNKAVKHGEKHEHVEALQGDKQAAKEMNEYEEWKIVSWFLKIFRKSREKKNKAVKQ